MPLNGHVDVLLVNPGSRTQIYQGLGSKVAAVEPPVWTGLLATYMRRKGVSVAVLDANAEDLAPAEVADRVRDVSPRLAAVVAYGQQPSASTQVMPSAGAICTALKDECPDVYTILVGGHVAALPERTLAEEDADFVCSGEGPVTLFELVQALKASASPEFSKVRGLLYRDGGETRSTPHAPLVRDLDNEMPGMAWDLLPMHLYRAHNWHCFGHLERQPYASLYTTFGCPYRCTFCCIQAPFKGGESLLGYKETTNSYRFWSPEKVIAQIDTLVNDYGVRNIKIADEMFVLNVRHVHGICDAIIERDYDLNIWAYSRIDTIKSDQTLEKLKRAGFHWLAFGLEAGSDRVRAEVDKRFEMDEMFDVLGRVRGAGINVIGNYIFGLPEDDLESMQATFDMALELNCEFANFYSAMAYPGSPLYRQAVAQGWRLPDSWSGYSQHAVDTLPLPTNYVSSGEVLKFRDHAFQVYFNSPRYLDMVAKKFGEETARHLREMTTVKLTRAFAVA